MSVKTHHFRIGLFVLTGAGLFLAALFAKPNEGQRHKTRRERGLPRLDQEIFVPCDRRRLLKALQILADRF